MSISLKINKLGSLENATIELKPFTIFFGKQATFKSYTLISVYGFFKMLEDVFYGGFEESYEREQLLSKFLTLVNYKKTEEEISIPSPEGKALKIKGKKLIFNVNGLIVAIKKLYKKYISEFFDYMLNHIPENDIDLEISLKEKFQELWIHIISEKPLQFDLVLKYENGKVRKVGTYVYALPPLLSEERKNANLEKYIIKVSLKDFFKQEVLGKYYVDLDFLSPNRIDIVDVEKILSIAVSLLREKFLSVLAIPGIVRETVLTYNKYNPTGKIITVLENNEFEHLKENLHNLLDKGYLKFRRTNIGANELFYITKEGKEVPIHATATSIKQLSLLYLALKYGNSTDKKILFIEEPEMNLHPELQMRLASLFSKIVSHGGWVFLTTHSDYFTLTLSSLIRIKYLEQKNDKVKKKLEELDLSLEEIPDIDKIGVYLFKKDNDKASVEKIKVSPEEGIPKDSFKETLDKLYELIEFSYGEIEYE